jgi:hypothetical protein
MRVGESGLRRGSELTFGNDSLVRPEVVRDRSRQLVLLLQDAEELAKILKCSHELSRYYSASSMSCRRAPGFNLNRRAVPSEDRQGFGIKNRAEYLENRKSGRVDFESLVWI